MESFSLLKARIDERALLRRLDETRRICGKMRLDGVRLGSLPRAKKLVHKVIFGKVFERVWENFFQKVFPKNVLGSINPFPKRVYSSLIFMSSS